MAHLEQQPDEIPAVERFSDRAEDYARFRPSCPGYPAISLRHGDVERMDSLFGSGRYRKLTWNHIQKLDSSALRERLFSSSYVPKSAAEPSHPLSLELSDLFDRCQAGGQIEMRYASTLYLGHLT